MSDAADDPGAEAGRDAGSAESSNLDFERAEFTEPAAEHVVCASCQQAITREYYQFAGKILCDTCRGDVQRTTEALRNNASLGRALLFGGGAALGCGIGYAIFVGLTNIQFALVTIGIGWAIGRAVQKATAGFGSRRHQIAAVVLAYVASAMGYFPALLGALRGAHPVGGLYAYAVLFGVMLAAPFLELGSGEASALIGLLIIFFGLRTAWRVSQGVTATVTGPHAVGSAAES